MVERLKYKVLVTPKDIPPTHPDLEVIGVFNPAGWRVGKDVYLLVRVAEAPKKGNERFSPRWNIEAEKPYFVMDEMPARDVEGDPRKDLDSKGLARLTFVSHIRLVKLDSDGFTVKYIDPNPTFYPTEYYEVYGVEDPRLTFIDGKYYFTYVGVSPQMGIVTALAYSEDFEKFHRMGIIFCQENKDVVILPTKFGGKYCAYHRPVPAHPFAPTNMQYAFSPDLIHWGEYGHLMDPRKGFWDSYKIGAGTVPILTSKGWLEIYHGVEMENDGNCIGVYRAGAALFHKDDPTKIIARSNKPILSPDMIEEKNGFVPDVIFPTALVQGEGNNVILYCGGADSVVTAIELSLDDIFESTGV